MPPEIRKFQIVPALSRHFFGQEDIAMKGKMTKGHEPTSKSGGMQSHLGASPDNNPTASRSVNTSFSGKCCAKGSSSPRHHTAAKKSGV